MTSAWWTVRSISAVAQVALGKMVGQSLKARLVVRFGYQRHAHRDQARSDYKAVMCDGRRAVLSTRHRRARFSPSSRGDMYETVGNVLDDLLPSVDASPRSNGEPTSSEASRRSARVAGLSAAVMVRKDRDRSRPLRRVDRRSPRQVTTDRFR